MNKHERRLAILESRARARAEAERPPELAVIDTSPEHCAAILEILHGAGAIEAETPEALAKLRRGTA